KEATAKLIAVYPFDGFEIAEPYFPEWNGLKSGNYGDVGPHAKAAFKEKFGLNMPEFSDTSSKDYYLNQPERYEQWTQFRVDTVNAYIHEIIHGNGGVKAQRPGIRIATWSLALDAGNDAIPLLKEMQGLDAPSLIQKVQPDLHFLQTHWPDWGKPRLTANYPKQYQPFMEQIWSSHPHMKLGIQADIGSAKQMVRSRKWLQGFASKVSRLHFSTWTAYEYHLGKYMYKERPAPMQAVRLSPQKITVSFQKRIDKFTVYRSQGLIFTQRNRSLHISICKTKIDGNQLLLESPDFPEDAFEIGFRYIQDTPDLWLFKGHKANRVRSKQKVHVPAWS
ncbi:MAG: hypothetical protein A2201_00760, partial [Alicyclobacillus sp. RIFOXYA1_FULL_53_8]